MATELSNDGGCPIAAFLREVVNYQGIYVTREDAMELSTDFDQDEDLLLRTAQLPEAPWAPGYMVADLDTAYAILRDRDPAYGPLTMS